MAENDEPTLESRAASAAPFITAVLSNRADLTKAIQACAELMHFYGNDDQLRIEKLNTTNDDGLTVLDLLKEASFNQVFKNGNAYAHLNQLILLLKKYGALSLISKTEFIKKRKTRSETPFGLRVVDPAIRALVNNSQGTHDEEVNASVKDSISALKNRYIADLNIDLSLKEITTFLEGLPDTHLLKKSAIDAFFYIQSNTQIIEGLSFKALMALIWRGVTDAHIEALPEGLIQLNPDDIKTRKIGFAQALVFAKPVCPEGQFNAIVGALNGIHRDVPSLLTKEMLKTQVRNQTQALIEAALQSKPETEQRAILCDWNNFDGVADAFRGSLKDVVSSEAGDLVAKGIIHQKLEAEFLKCAGALISLEEIKAQIEDNVAAIEDAPCPSVYRPLSELINKIFEYTLPVGAKQSLKQELKDLKTKSMPANLFNSAESYEKIYKKLNDAWVVFRSNATPTLSVELQSCLYGNELVHTLNGTNVNHRGPFDVTALHLAVQSQRIDKVKQLLDLGADLNLKDYEGNTPLHYACMIDSAEILTEFIKRYPQFDLNRKNINDMNPLLIAVASGNCTVVQSLLSNPMVDVHIKNRLGQNALCLAAYYNQADVVRVLLDDDRINPNDRQNNGPTPLIMATLFEHKEVMQVLLSKGRVDPNRANNTKLSFVFFKHYFDQIFFPLAIVIMAFSEIMSIYFFPIFNIALKAYGFDFRFKRSNLLGTTPLHHAVMSNRPALVQLLCSNLHVELGKTSFSGNNALHFAMSLDANSSAKILLNHKDALPALLSKNINGNTPLVAAILAENAEGVELIVEKLKQQAFSPREMAPYISARTSFNPFHICHQQSRTSLFTSLFNRQFFYPNALGLVVNDKQMPDFLKVSMVKSLITLHPTKVIQGSFLKAIASKQYEVVKAFSQSGEIDLFQKTVSFWRFGGNTPLHIAVQTGDLQTVKALLSDNISYEQFSDMLQTANAGGQKPLDLAYQLGFEQIFEFLNAFSETFNCLPEQIAFAEISGLPATPGFQASLNPRDRSASLGSEPTHCTSIADTVRTRSKTL